MFRDIYKPFIGCWQINTKLVIYHEFIAMISYHGHFYKVLPFLQSLELFTTSKMPNLP